GLCVVAAEAFQGFADGVEGFLAGEPFERLTARDAQPGCMGELGGEGIDEGGLADADGSDDEDGGAFAVTAAVKLGVERGHLGFASEQASGGGPSADFADGCEEA